MAQKYPTYLQFGRMSKLHIFSFLKATLNKFFDLSTPPMRKIDDGEKEKEKKKITVEIVATNILASRPPNGDRLQRRPLVPKVYLHEIDNKNI